ncbi:hypothetical protein Poli38472_011591 [Pythium oligandrum]|uniref:Dynein heavy chain n=1 Tax=Pythium oligandrum TaxID=41045 RepID=A0A8K1FJA5_PYTOL|nr:hypothetical protein Poli38472_011591 [Pythium oligandrum]|eukprot:TMW64711.1 hypothetical protein Poli38472_011591 [Pythium oligandrum]
MDVLTEQGVVRESDIFTLLFPRGYTPKPEEAQRTTKGAEGVADSPRDDTDATTPRPRIPPLKMLSPKTPRSLLSSFPMTAYDCTVVWTFVCDWVKAQVAMEAPAVIPGLGSVTLRTQALKIRIPFFEPDRAFMAKHGLRMDPSLIPLQGAAAKSTRVLTTGNNTLPDQAVPVLRHSSDVLAFSYMEMAACCGRNMDAAKAKECLQVVIQKIGESMRHCERVEVDLGAGVVVCMNRVMESHMLPRHTNIQPTIDYEVRTGESIVKRTLQSIAATSPTAKKTKASFLTSSELGCAIQVNPAATESSSRPSDLFVFDMGSNSRRTRLTVLPQSTKSVSASPRTQQLQARLKKQSSLENDSSDAQKSVIASGFEPLFDTISRTFCVEPDLNLATLLPSNRIAANYTPSSASLVIARSKGSSGMVQSAGLIFVEDVLPFDVFEESCDNRKERVQSRHGGGEDSDHIDSERRYFAYLEDSNRLMDSRWLAPLSSLLVKRIIASAIKYLNSNPTGYMREILSAAQQEFVNNYNFSVKKSILDYLMLRRASRNRLSIVYGTPPHTKLPPRWKWGDSTSDDGCMGDLKALAAAATAIPGKHRRQSATKASEVQENSLQQKKRRHKYVKSKLLSSLMIVDPGIRALHFMWYDFASTILLIKLPSVEELSGSLKPMDIQDFENEQFKHGQMIRAQVVMTWYNRAKDLFEGTLIKPRRNHSGAQVDARTKHILDSTAVQMSIQVRSLVLASVRAYVSFFELFRRSAQSGGSEDESNVTSPVYSGLLLSLTLQHGQVQFKTPLVEVPSLLLNVLHSLPQLFYNLNRIETQFSEPLPIDSSDSPFLWNTSSQEDEFVVATVQIREIIETNLVELKALLLEYEDFSSVFRHVQSAQSQVDAVSTDIATCQREIERIRPMSKRLITTTRARRYLRLFTVDCGDVNHALLGAFNEWVARLLAAFAERTAHMNGELRQQYKDVAARIAKRPVDLYELVDAEGYIDYLKTSKLQELQQSVQEIKDRMRFLLFQQESATRVDEDAAVEHHCAAGDDDNSSPRNEKASPRRRGARSGEFHVSIELLSSTAKTIRWRAHIERLLGDAEASLVGERARIEAIFLARRNRFQAEVEEFDAEVKSFSKKGDLRHAATYVVQLGKMKDVLQSFRKQMESIVAEESMLQWKPTDFSKLDDIAEEMEPYEQLWRTAREFRELSSRWLRSNVYELQAQEGVHGLQQMLATITSVSNLLQINSAATAITAELIKKQMLDFRENTRLVAAILNLCMQERHLTEVSAVIGLTLDREEPLTLLKLLENGAFDHLARIVEISENATMEAEVAKSLRRIETEWQDVCFKFKPPKEQTGRRTSKFTNGVSSDMVLLKSSVDEIKVLVEDHLLRLQTLQCLRHAATFAMEISSWLRFLHEVHEVADLLEATQLQSILVKATIKLFRVLRSDKWTLASTPSSSAASSQFTSAMAFQPSKAHYLFHQRDILEVLKGVCCDTRVSLSFAEKPLIARLWCHESARVFGDRLSNKRDTDIFFQLLHTLVLSQFSLTSEVFVPPFLDVSALSGPSKHLWLQRHLHFTFIGESSGAGMIDGYREVNELHKVEQSIEQSMMAMYRANVLTESLEFVLCTYVIHHVMRLSRVLRRSDQHVLCVGQRGRKMLSITRLAVFICRKNVHVFNAPREHRDAIAVWTTFLRSVVLQCFRQPDESAVLVIKDAWLACPEIYATIDQLLGGYRLFSDIISYDELDETVLLTLRNEAERDHECSDASSRPMYDSTKLLNSKGAVLDYLYVCLRRRLQVVLLFALPQGTIESSQASWKLAEILWRYTHLQRSCTINYMGEWPEESLVTVAQKCLTTQFGSEKDRLTQLSQATVQVYLETQRAMGEWTGMCPDSTDLNQHQDDHEPSRSSTGPPLPSSELVNMASLSVVPSLLVEQISLFTTYYPRLQRDVDATKSRFERGLEFIERTDQILALEQSQQQMLQPEMAKRTIATRRMSGNLEREKLTANKLTKALEMETALVESQRQRLQQVELEYDDLVREARLVFEEKQASITVFQVAVAEGNGVDEGEVSTVDDGVEGQGQPPHLKEAATRRLRRSMIRTFIALAQVPTSLRQLAECYGLIFGIEPVEACDELDPDEIVMDYWESTTARMRDVAFWNVLASFDVRKYMNEKILARILPVCTAPDFDVALLSAVHEVAGVLCDWVKACALYSRDFLLAEPKYLQLCNERELFRAAVAQMNARQAEMDLQANTTSNVNAMRTLTEQERKDIEAKLKDTTSTLQMALSVWKVLESTKEKWRKKYEDATTKSVQMMGDVILATALIAYGPTLTARARVALRQRWCAVLNRFYIVHSSLPPRLLSTSFLSSHVPLCDGKWMESQRAMQWR